MLIFIVDVAFNSFVFTFNEFLCDSMLFPCISDTVILIHSLNFIMCNVFLIN